MTHWWEWKDQPVKAGRYLCCWGSKEDGFGYDYKNNLYEVHYYDGNGWRIPHTRPNPMYYAEITHPQEENMLRELNEMI